MSGAASKAVDPFYLKTGLISHSFLLFASGMLPRFENCAAFFRRRKKNRRISDAIANGQNLCTVINIAIGKFMNLFGPEEFSYLTVKPFRVALVKPVVYLKT